MCVFEMIQIRCVTICDTCRLYFANYLCFNFREIESKAENNQHAGHPIQIKRRECQRIFLWNARLCRDLAIIGGNTTVSLCYFLVFWKGSHMAD